MTDIDFYPTEREQRHRERLAKWWKWTWRILFTFVCAGIVFCLGYNARMFVDKRIDMVEKVSLVSEVCTPVRIWRQSRTVTGHSSPVTAS